MERLELHNIVAAASYVGGTLKMMEVNRSHILMGQVLHQSIATQDYAHILRAVEAIGHAGGRLRLVGTTAAAARAAKALEGQFRAHGTYGSEALGRLIGPLSQLLTAFVDETEACGVFGMTGRRSDVLASQDAPLGQAVASSFPRIQEDLREAGACLALDRATACVFHLMRAMEAAVQALAGHLGVSGTTREWGKLLSDMSCAVEALPKGRTRDAWSENHSLLYHVKQAWRNDVMHPRRSYSVDEAAGIYDAVASYLRQLAELTATPPTAAGAAAVSADE